MDTLISDNSRKDTILTRIESGETPQKPKWHFTIRTIISVTILVFLAAALLYFVSFILFELTERDVIFTPEFGWQGISVFLSSLPWILIALTIAMALAIEMLIRRYSLAYRRPLVYSLLFVIAAATVGGVLISETHLHEHVSQFVEDQNLPVAAFYRGYTSRPLPRLYSGIVSELDPNGFFMQSSLGELLDVIVSRQTRFPHGMDIVKDDAVLVIGDRSGDTIQAAGVRCLNDRPRQPNREPEGWPTMK